MDSRPQDWSSFTHNSAFANLTDPDNEREFLAAALMEISRRDGKYQPNTIPPPPPGPSSYEPSSSSPSAGSPLWDACEMPSSHWDDLFRSCCDPSLLKADSPGCVQAGDPCTDPECPIEPCDASETVCSNTMCAPPCTSSHCSDEDAFGCDENPFPDACADPACTVPPCELDHPEFQHDLGPHHFEFNAFNFGSSHCLPPHYNDSGTYCDHAAHLAVAGLHQLHHPTGHQQGSPCYQAANHQGDCESFAHLHGNSCQVLEPHHSHSTHYHEHQHQHQQQQQHDAMFNQEPHQHHYPRDPSIFLSNLSQKSATPAPSHAFSSDHYQNTVYSSSPAITEHKCHWLTSSDPTNPTICGLAFSTSGELAAHAKNTHINACTRCTGAKTAHNNASFACRWAGCTSTGQFISKPKLVRHVITHTGFKEFLCPYCGKGSTTKDQHAKHLRTHTHEKPYACQYCEKCFTTKTELSTHTGTHTKIKPHACDICHKRFVDSSNLSKHRMVHFTGKFTCHCGARMKRWDQMRRHFETTGHRLDLVQKKGEEVLESLREVEWRARCVGAYKAEESRKWAAMAMESKRLPMAEEDEDGSAEASSVGTEAESVPPTPRLLLGSKRRWVD